MLWFVEDGKEYWVVVREVRYPAPKAEMPENVEQIAEACSVKAVGGGASVSLGNRDDPFDPEAANNGNYLPLYRGMERSRVSMVWIKSCERDGEESCSVVAADYCIAM